MGHAGSDLLLLPEGNRLWRPASVRRGVMQAATWRMAAAVTLWKARCRWWAHRGACWRSGGIRGLDGRHGKVPIALPTGLISNAVGNRGGGGTDPRRHCRCRLPQAVVASRRGDATRRGARIGVFVERGTAEPRLF